MDYKCKSSLMEKTMMSSNLEKLKKTDVLKFVINSDDFECVEEILNGVNIKSYVYISSIF